MTGIYIHIPFCKKKCLYCDFYSLPPEGGSERKYLSALERQIASFSGEADTVYFGGGTPSLLPPSALGRILTAVRRSFSLSDGCEITLEANPATIGYDGLAALRQCGFNRVSVGVQSFSDRTLAALGRPHGKKAALAVIGDARRAGFSNISADLMLALPHEGEREIGAAVRALSGAGVAHISAYLLKLMPGTPFHDAPPPGIPDDDRQAELYQYASAAIEESGYRQYEISNFAKPGCECRHNLKYWNCESYYGFGAAAHSLAGNRRYSFPPDMGAFCDTYLRAPPANPFTPFRDEGAPDAADYIMMRLRLADGLSLAEMERRYGQTFSEEKMQKIRLFASAGLLSFDGGAAALTRAGFLVSNSVIAALI